MRGPFGQARNSGGAPLTGLGSDRPLQVHNGIDRTKRERRMHVGLCQVDQTPVVTMSKQNEHGKLIAAAAKAALLPLGCQRKGQSRCWYSDERFWCIFIEFQPSAWSRGTYLNIGPIWFFLQPQGGETTRRLNGYIEFESVEQFRALIEPAAGLVAAEVVALRTKFRTVLDIHRFFADNLSRSGNVYRAAVTAGLVGDFALSRQLFARIAGLDPSKHGLNLKKIQDESAALARLLDDPQAYRSAILEKIEARRQADGFPPDRQCLDSLQLPRIE
jgi:hypothetical protein